MRIAMLAPPWLPVPPPTYGGIEAVVHQLCEGLVRHGHDVTLFAAPGSSSSAEVVEVLPTDHGDQIERALHEADHVACVFAAVDEAVGSRRPFDVVHDHCGFTAFAMADRLSTPLVHTLHGPFVEETSGFYARHARKAPVVALSQAQRRQAPPGLRFAAVVPNPVDPDAWPVATKKQDYVLWIGRFTEVKGPHRAIAAAREAGVPLVMAGPVQPGDEEFFAAEVEPHLDGSAVRHVGAVGGEEKASLFAGARALLMPITWPEPFGMVMVEALACGTPVVAFDAGAAPEIVLHGRTGFVVEDLDQMVAAIGRLDEIDPHDCRADVEERFGVDQVTRAYERVYAEVVASRVSRFDGAVPA
jgi:glycosyltransferase involved in cell wall biosynthesis